MLAPSILTNSLLNDWMGFDPFRDLDDVDRRLYGKNAPRLMSTDVCETDEGYELDIDLPGFKKEEINLKLDHGYLNVSAAKALDKEEKKHGKVIRQERYSGAMQRSFYVGDAVTEEDVKAKFEHGVLKLSIPKKDPAKVEEKSQILIEG